MVEVIQADRDAAALVACAGSPGLGNGNKAIGDEIKGGLHDGYLLIQAFARHRIEAIASLEHRLSEAERALEPFALVADTLCSDEITLLLDGEEDVAVHTLRYPLREEVLSTFDFRRARSALSQQDTRHDR